MSRTIRCCKPSVGDCSCATNLCINRVGVVKEWADSLASRM